MTPTPEQDAALLEELAESGLVKSYNDDLRAAAALIRDLAAREARMREALEFYARRDNYKMRRERSYRDRFSQNMKPGRLKLGRVSEDNGKRARAALGDAQ